MRPILEPRGEGNCLQVSVAVLLEMDQDDVPENFSGRGRWIYSLAEWADLIGYDCRIGVYLGRAGRPVNERWRVLRELPAGYYIGVIAPFSGARCHAVVMKGREVVYDVQNYVGIYGPRSRYQKRGMLVIELKARS